MAGRKSKYTPEVVARIVQAIELGATYELAAGYGGITFETFRVWRETKSGFSDAIKAAEARGALGWLAKIEKAANEGVWTAAAWKLERRYPQDYGRTVHETQLTGKDGKELTILIGQRPDGPQPQ